VRDAPSLLRVVGTRRLAATIFNTVVGAGIFALPGVIAGLSGTAAPIAYLACTGAILLVALSYASAGSRVTKAGGSYAYVAAGLGPMVGAIGGVLAWLADTLAAASVAAGLMSALGTYLPLAAAGMGRAVVMTTVIAVIGAINIRGVRQGAAVVEGVTVAKLVPLLLFVLVGASLMTWDARLMPTWPTVDVLGRTMLVLMFAFSGAETALSLSGEVEHPERTVPRALLMALTGISLLYSSVHMVAFGALGQGLASSTAAPLADAGAQLAGPWLGTMMLAGTVVSMLGYLSAALMSQPRLLYSLAAGGLLPGWLTAIHPRFRTPWTAIAVQNTIVLAAALSGSFAVLVPLASVAILAVYLLVALSAMVMQRRVFQPPGAFTVPIAVPIGAALLAVWMLSNARPDELVLQAVVIVAAVVVVIVRRRALVAPAVAT
jgi:basic amino acid/polyamine antiporter, APA family